MDFSLWKEFLHTNSKFLLFKKLFLAFLAVLGLFLLHADFL